METLNGFKLVMMLQLRKNSKQWEPHLELCPQGHNGQGTVGIVKDIKLNRLILKWMFPSNYF